MYDKRRLMRLGLPLVMVIVGLILATAVASSMRKNEIEGDVQSDQSKKRYGVKVNRPAGPPRVLTDHKDVHGNVVTVACSSCHATKKPNPALTQASQLTQFHQGMTFRHGNLSCLSCHNSGDYDALRLADGRKIAYRNVMDLCAQCHGPQHRDYQRGSHGGMRGYWDLTKGPRQRNNCVDCHDPHVPRYQKVLPVFPPLVPGGGASHG